MDIFFKLYEAAGAAPAWVSLALLPALLLLSAMVFFVRRGKLYPVLAGILGAAGTMLFPAREQAGFYALSFLLVALLLGLPQFLPRRKKKPSREERIYDKFHEELKRPEEVLQRSGERSAPPKVCCFEEPPATESDVRLTHAETLIRGLRKAKLSASDRLELDVLCRTMEGCRGRALTEREHDMLNDCLASVLRLTAKYKL